MNAIERTCDIANDVVIPEPIMKAVKIALHFYQKELSSFLQENPVQFRVPYIIQCPTDRNNRPIYWDKYCYADQVMSVWKMVVGYYNPVELVIDWSGMTNKGYIWLLKK